MHTEQLRKDMVQSADSIPLFIDGPPDPFTGEAACSSSDYDEPNVASESCSDHEPENECRGGGKDLELLR